MTKIYVKLNGIPQNPECFTAGKVYEGHIDIQNSRGMLVAVTCDYGARQLILVDHEFDCAHLESGEWNQVEDVE